MLFDRPMLRVLSAVTALVAATTTAVAQPATAPPPADPLAAFDAEIAALVGRPGGLTAADAARRAAKTSPAAERKRAEVAAAKTTIGTIKIALLPITKVTASYTRLSDVGSTQLAPGVAFAPVLNSMHVGAELAVPLTELIFRLPPAKRAAEHQVTATELAGQAAELDAASQAELLYYEWVRVQLATVVAERQVAQVEATRAQLAVLVDVQRASRADLLQLEAGKAQAELAVVQLRQAAQVLTEQLRVLIGAGADEPLTIGEDLRADLALPELPDDARLAEAALGRRLDARAVAAATSAIDERYRETATQKLPRVNLFAQVAYDNPNQRIFPQADEFRMTWAAGVQVAWTVNDFLFAQPNLDQVTAQRAALAADRRGLEMGIATQIASARSGLALADAAYTTSQRGLAAAAEAYRVRQDLLANERATATDLITAEGSLTSARLSAINALIDRRVAWARLRHAAGLDVP
jgi:outer membrane protein